MKPAGSRVVVRGGGDLGSGTALRLWRCGIQVCVLETSYPKAVRRSVSFSEAVYDGNARVEEGTAYLCKQPSQALEVLHRGDIPVLVDSTAQSLSIVQPDAVVDAIVAKRNLGTAKGMARVVVCLGPGFVAGVDCHAVVETNRGPNLGRVLWAGGAEANTGVPGSVLGASSDRVLRAPTSGVLHTNRNIGDQIVRGDIVGSIERVSIVAAVSGVVRGLLRDGLEVQAGEKIGDIDPRGDTQLCWLVSDKAMAIAGGVVEAICLGMQNHD